MENLGRKDWQYVNLRIEMIEALQYIVKEQGHKYGFEDGSQLIRHVLREFILKYERQHNIVIATDAITDDKSNVIDTVQEDANYIKMDEETRNIFPRINKTQWNRIERDVAYRDGFFLGINALGSRISAITKGLKNQNE